MVVKVCGLTSTSDAAIAVDCGADMVGFVFEPTSKRFVSERSEVSEWRTSATKVAVFGARADGPVAGFDLHQAGDLAGFAGIRAVRPKPGESVESLVVQAAGCELVVLDKYDPSAFGGTGEVLDWGFCAEFVSAFGGRTILAGGLTPENVASAIERVGPWGVDACTGLEREVGVKDPEKVAGFVARAKGA